MIVYRLTNGEYINDLSGTGAKLYGGRWNSPGLPALYTAGNISLAVLEILVHIKSYRRPLDYHLITIEIPDTADPVTIDQQKLKKSWKDDIAYGQFIGDEFLNAGQFLFLKVPSAIIDQENNFLINPSHPDAGKIKIRSSKIFIFDKRLYLKDE
ncbi:MAG: superfamily protein [Ferruginibacter sp.]|nr:superfamily protein [Ferruginibacter sp.]